jgi:Ca-activated chloride channel family protein
MSSCRGIFLLLAAAAVFSGAAFAQTDDEVIKVDSSIVVLNASITDAGGRAVSGLQRSQFHVFDDGIEQKIESFSSEETPFAAVILLDTSGSMESRVSVARSAAITFLDGLRTSDVAAIYNFDSKVSMVQDFSNSRDLRDGFFDLKAGGMTVLNDAVFRAAEVLSKRPEKRRAIILLSDGADTMSGKSAEAAVKAALAANATLYAVDMADTDGMNAADRPKHVMFQMVLKGLAEKTGGKFIASAGSAAIRDGFRRIGEELGVQYTITYSPAMPSKDGKWHSLELRVARPGLTIRTRKGYNSARN